MLVENLLGGQQDPKALQPLLDAHIYLRLKNGFKTTTWFKAFHIKPDIRFMRLV
jgi:hypothetical protein